MKVLGLPKLQPTKIVKPNIIFLCSGKTDSKLHFETLKLPTEERRRIRSQTFQGIAQAMAIQWGGATKEINLMQYFLM